MTPFCPLDRTEFTYDGLNRNTSIKDPANRSVTFLFNPVNKTARIDSESQRTNYTYDVRHRLTGVNYVGRTADNRTYAYDLVGQLLSVTEPGKAGGQTAVAYTYDALGRQLTETSHGKTHVYTYDLANNRIAVTYGGTGTVLTSSYDALNRLATLTENGRVTTYGYDLNGNRAYQQLPNGEEVEALFDALNRQTAIVTTKAGGGSLLELEQAYDLVGNVVRITESYPGSTLSGRTVTNTYDGVNRLVVGTTVEAAAKTTATAYAFDKANNRIAKAVATTTGGATTVVDTAYAYNNLNQLQTTTEGTKVTTYTYDHNGNRKTVGRQQAGASVGTDTYGYDYENRLTTLTVGSQLAGAPAAPGTYTYVYDYRTRRVQRAENGTTTKLVFSGGVSVAEYDGAATPSSPPSAEYIRGSDWGGGVGGLLYSIRGGVPSFKHYNSRGDVISATDDTGAATWQAIYEAFGTRTQEVGTTQDRQKANTKEEDPTGLLNEGFRYRCLETGVFITRDPLGFVDGPNMYAYVVQNPWSKFDPNGLQASEEPGQVVFDSYIEDQTPQLQAVPPPPPPPPQSARDVSDENDPNNASSTTQSGQVVVFVVDGAGTNVFDHTGVAVRGPDGKLVYYDVQAESKSNPRPDGSVNKYTLEEFRKTYGDRNPRYTVVDVPDINRAKNALEVTNRLWGAGGYGYDAANRNCTGFVCDVLYKGGYEVRMIPGNRGENPWRYPNDLEQSLRYFNAPVNSTGGRN